MWLLANWKLLAIGGAALAMFSAGWYVESRLAESRLEHALEAQETALLAACKADKAITKEVADELQTKNAALARRIADLKRLHPPTCIVPTPNTAIGGNAGSSGTVASGTNGITADALLDFAGESERYRLQLISCQDFITKTWSAKGQ